MPTVTPSFNWPVPVSTDLVKDGATAIESLGDAIDASMADLKGGTTGQVLAKNSATDMDFIWVTDAAGDITNVSVTSPITGGGSSGSVTIGIDSTAVVPSQTGNSGKYLTTNGTASSWGTVAGWSPNYQLLNAGGTEMSGSSTITISGISGIQSLFIRVGGDNLVKNANANSSFRLRLNTDTGNNYYYAGLALGSGGSNPFPQSTTVAANFLLGIFGATANSTYVISSIQIDGCGTAGIKTITSTTASSGASTADNQSIVMLGSYNGTSAISSISLVGEGNFTGTGRVFVYGA